MLGTVWAVCPSCTLQGKLHLPVNLFSASTYSSGHLEVVNLLLSQPGICVNIRNNDRLTCFMLAMQVGRDASGWTGSGQEQLKKMMDLPSLSEVDWARNDRVGSASHSQ